MGLTGRHHPKKKKLLPGIKRHFCCYKHHVLNVHGCVIISNDTSRARGSQGYLLRIFLMGKKHIEFYKNSVDGACFIYNVTFS